MRSVLCGNDPRWVAAPQQKQKKEKKSYIKLNIE